MPDICCFNMCMERRSRRQQLPHYNESQPVAFAPPANNEKAFATQHQAYAAQPAVAVAQGAPMAKAVPDVQAQSA